ncbi:MAG TPA: O-antigen ligase family protein [Candidatus Dormibacteraeota bacterium]
MSSFSTRRHRLDAAGHWLRTWPIHPVRAVMLAALPLAVLAGSPQRVGLSAGIAVAYVAAAVMTLGGQRVDRMLLAYVGVAAAWMALSWLRTRYLLHLQPDQLSYGIDKTLYFVLIVLPMAAAVALMIERAEAVWPAAIMQIAIGAGVAVLTVVLMGERFLGAQRYSWQGDLIALGTVLAIQPWPVQRFKASAIIGVLGVFGIGLAGSRQAVAAAIVAMLASAAFWGTSRYLSAPRRRLRFALSGRYVLLPLAIVALLVAYIGITYAGDLGLHLTWTGLTRASGSMSCNCVSDRLISLEASPGDRDQLLLRGVHLFATNPILGAGLGSFAGAIPDSLQAGHFYQYPHNVLLELAAETGIVGVLLVMGPLLVGWAALFWRGVQTASAPIANILMFVAVFFTVANISGDIPSERGLWIFGIVAFRLGVEVLRVRGRSPAGS